MCSFFIEAEEDAIIKLDQLQRQAAATCTAQLQAGARAALVDFHGELSCVQCSHSYCPSCADFHGELSCVQCSRS